MSSDDVKNGQDNAEKPSKYAGIGFKCQGCGGVFYCLTEKFVPTPPMRGDYVALLPKYGPEGFNWYDFPHNEWTIGDNVACVQCGEPIRTGHVLKIAEEHLERLRQEESRGEDIQGDPGEKKEGEGNEGLLSSDADNGGDVGSSLAASADNDGSCGDNNGLYDNVDLEDNLLSSVLKMTAAGETQATIAETCGISIYRVRKLQNGDLT